MQYAYYHTSVLFLYYFLFLKLNCIISFCTFTFLLPTLLMHYHCFLKTTWLFFNFCYIYVCIYVCVSIAKYASTTCFYFFKKEKC